MKLCTFVRFEPRFAIAGCISLHTLKKKCLFLTCTVFAFFFAQPVPGQNTGHPETTIKVLTYNIHHAVSVSGTNSLDQIADLVNQIDPDFVALQECDFITKRSGYVDQVKELVCKTKLNSLFARAMYYDGGEFGDGILSKTTFLSTRNVQLPTATGHEPRAAASIITVLPSGDTIIFIGTHLDHLGKDSIRLQQAHKILGEYKGSKYPLLFAGDLNDFPGKETLNLFEKSWCPTYDKLHPEPTFPSDKPGRKIDYVMYSPKEKWEVLSTEVLPNSGASDHCALLVTLRFK